MAITLDDEIESLDHNNPEHVEKAHQLTRKQQLFIDEYLIDLNATQAAIRAGYSEDSARVIGHDNLTKPYIAEAIQARMDDRAKRTEITADRVLIELGKMGFADTRELFDENGNLRPIHELGDNIAASIASFEVVSRSAGTNEDGSTEIEYVHKVKLADKKASLDLLGKNLKLFSDRVEHTGKDGEPIQVVIESDDAKLL